MWLVSQEGTSQRCNVSAITGQADGRRLEDSAEAAADVVTCHGTRLRLSPNGSTTERAAAQLVHQGIVSPVLGANSPVHYWRHVDQPRRAGYSALCHKQAAWHVLTFGSHGKYERAAARVCKTALHAGADSCSSSTLDDLPAQWRTTHNVSNTTRGLGHWKWKPFVILRRLRELQNGDVMLYVDRDLRLGSNLSALFCLGQNADRVACFHQACYTERAWTSHELATAVGAGPPELDSVQINGGLQVWRRSLTALALATKYLRWTERFARGPSDSAEERTHNKAYRDHRHDQSCFSLLVKQEKIQSYPWPLRAHDRRDVWAWEAGYCSPHFTFPFEPMPNSLDLDYGSESSAQRMCRKNQGGAVPPMRDYQHMVLGR